MTSTNGILFGLSVTPLNYYTRDVLSTTWTGALTSAVNITCVRVGSTVTVSIPYDLQTAVANLPLTSAAGIAAQYRPSAVVRTITYVVRDNTTTTGLATINTSGIVNIYADISGANFSSNKACAYTFNLSYNL